jgi:hypothetical protein
MVDQLTIQTIGVLVAASSVVLYIVNLLIANKREEKNKKVALTNTMIQNFGSQQMIRNVVELLELKWNSLEDFQKKYDSTVDIDIYTKRSFVLWQLDNIGYLLKEKLVDPEVVYTAGGTTAIWMWAKFGDVIREYRKVAWGLDTYRNFEYLAVEMWKMKKLKDPSFSADLTYFPSGTFDKAFS